MNILKIIISSNYIRYKFYLFIYFKTKFINATRNIIFYKTKIKKKLKVAKVKSLILRAEMEL